MLVLTRKPGEAIHIGENIKITLVEVDGNNIKIGIEAPREVAIHREEVYQRILEENRAAAAKTTIDMGSFANLFKGKR